MKLDGLNDRQLEAVKATEGKVRIIAGAGSGKTRVLAYRYAYLVDELGIDPGNILCLTFTNKAAQEMRSRICRILGIEQANDFICTVHSFCVKFLREEIFRLGYPKNFQILDAEDMKALAKESFTELNIDRTESTVEQFLHNFSKDKFPGWYVPSVIVPTESKTDELKEIQGLIKMRGDNYAKLFISTLLKQKKYLALDFNDLIYFTIHILNEFPEVCQKWQMRMNYVMVDEVQDCTSLEWVIYQTLSAKHGNLFIVGDPDQNIYEWRGADPTAFVVYKPDTDIILDQNYRSTSTILDAANSIIDYNTLRIKKDLYTVGEKGDVITHFHGKDEREEADWISQQIKKLTKKKLLKKGATYSDFAILVRASYLTRSIEQSFLRNEIPYVIWGGVRFFERREIKDSLSYLRLIAGDDDIAFKRIANVPSRKIGKSTMEKISAIAKIQNCSMYEALKTLTQTKGYNKDSILQFIDAIETVRDCVGKMSISDLLDYIIRKSGLLEMYRNDEEEERLENISELINSIKTYEADHKEDDITLDHYLQDIALYTNADYAKDKDQVKMMTIHQAKGLEFPYVFIAGLSEGIMPNKRSVRERKHKAMEEERRLMYVAVTRAEQKLFLTESEGFSMQGGFEKYPSRFIREIKQGLFVTEGRMDQSIWNQAISFSKNFDRECELGIAEGIEENLFFEGDKVRHSHFGVGTVIKAYDNGEFCEVDFESFGVRAIKSDKLSQA